MDLGIHGRVALVTASSRGLGRAIADALAAEGADVAMCARGGDAVARAADEVRAAHGVRTFARAADVGNPAQLAELVAGATAALGRIEILVTNTGGPAPGGFDACDDERWEAAVRDTLMNVVRLVRLVAGPMKAAGWGRIVNVASTTAWQPIAGLAMSNALRPAIVGLAKTLADELAPHNVLVNTVCPGLHRTARVMHLAAGPTEAERAASLARLTEAIPLRRLGDPAELAAAVAFLCSERASFVTGTTLTVDGGSCRGLT